MMASNIQILTENIRMALAYSDQTPLDTMRQLATEYADHCKTLTDRFTQILPFLKSHNISEAVRYAEMSPNVIDTYTALDFEGRQDWADICDALGFPVPAVLPQELFLQLQDAYNTLQPLEYLLQQNRILALNGSPVRDRLVVIRALAQKDVRNLFWAEDQEQFEKIRLGQLNADIQRAIKDANDSQIRLLYEELTMPGWRVPPPPQYLASLVEQVLKGRAQILDKQANAYDFEAAQQTHRAMLNLLQQNRLAMPQSVADYIAPALQWMVMEQQTRQSANDYVEAENELRYALDNDEAQHELENLYYALHNVAVKSDKAVPQDLELRYQERIDGLERKTMMRRRIILATVIGTCVLFAGLIGAGIWAMIRNEEIAKILIVLQEIETEKRFEEIENTLARIQTEKPSMAKTAEVALITARLQSLLEEDNKRAEDFARYAAQAGTALEPKPAFRELKSIVDLLKQAESFVRTDSEREQLANLKSQHKLQTAQRQREIDEIFGNALAKLSQGLNDIPRTRDAVTFASLAELERQVKDLLEKSPDISMLLRNEGTDLRTLLAERQNRIKDTIAEETALQKLFQCPTDLLKFQSSLSSFMAQYPKHPAVPDFKAVVATLDKVQEIYVDTQTLCKEYNNCAGDYAKLQKAAPVIFQKCTELSNKITLPAGSLFGPAAGLSAFAESIPFDKHSLDDIEETLLLLARKDLYPYVTPKGQWYYCTTMPSTTNRAPEFVTTFSSSGRKMPVSIPSKELNQEEKQKTSPQKDWAVKTLTDIEALKSGTDIKSVGIGSILTGLLQQEGLDPIMQVVMLHSFIEHYGKTDPFFGKAFKDVNDRMKKSKIDVDTNWLDVDSSDTIPEREKCKVFLDQLPKLGPLFEKIRRETEQFQNRLKSQSPNFRLLGILHQDGATWTCFSKELMDAEDGELLVFSITGEKATPLVVGSIRDGKAVFRGVSQMRQGLPVFLKQ